jgi:hypothetical protein
MRVDAKETFTESDKDGNVQNGIGGQLVKLNPVDEEQTAEKFMEGDGKTTDEEVDKCYLEVDGGMRSALITRKAHGFLVEQAQPLQHLVVLSSCLRALPSGDLGLLCGLAGVRGSGCASLGVRHAAESERE